MLQHFARQLLRMSNPLFHKVQDYRDEADHASIVVPGLIAAEVVNHFVRILGSEAAQVIALADQGFTFLEKAVGDRGARVQGLKVLTELAELGADVHEHDQNPPVGGVIAVVFHVALHLLDTGDGPDFVVGILPAVLQSRNEGELLLLEELILLLDAAEGLFHLIHCCS